MMSARNCWIGLALALLAASAQAHDKGVAHDKATAHQQPTPDTSLRIEIDNVELRDQQGRKVRLLDDVIGGRLVVMDFIYTSCTTACPILSAVMGQVQQQLGDRVGRDVRLISMSVDPVTDTPARLKAYAKKVGAGEGWTFLTGEKATVDPLLVRLGAYTPDTADHPAMVMVGDPATGRWVRYYGFATPDVLLGHVERLTNERAHAAR